MPVSPTRLTVPPHPSISERVKVIWRETDYGNRLDRAIQAPQLRRCVTIALMSPKGGVGKTTLTALLGSMLAMTRRDRIVAVDNNLDTFTDPATVESVERRAVDCEQIRTITPLGG